MSCDLGDIVLLKISCDQGAFFICNSVLMWQSVLYMLYVLIIRTLASANTLHSSRDVFKFLSF